MPSSPASEHTHRELVDALTQAVRKASTATVIIHTLIAESFGLNVSEWKCGDLVNRHGALTAGQLAAMTGLTTGTITGIIDRLEQAGFVHRVPDVKDRRKVWVRAAEERSGEIQQRLDEAFGAVLSWMDEFTDEQLALILRFTENSTELMLQSAEKLRSERGTKLVPGPGE